MMMRRPRVTVCKKQDSDDEDESLLNTSTECEDEKEEEEEEWVPESKVTKPRKKPVKPKEPKPPKPPKAPKAPKAPKVPKTPKPKAPKKTAAEKPKVGRKTKASALEKDAGVVGVPVKEERLSFIVTDGNHNETEQYQGAQVKEATSTKWPQSEKQGKSAEPKELKHDLAHLPEGPSSSYQLPGVKKEEPEDDFTFDEPALKKMKTAGCPDGKPVKHYKKDNSSLGDVQMNWDIIQVLSERTVVDPWVCENLVNLFKEENTIPFIVRYRKELINHMDADAVRDVQLTMEELRNVAKKVHAAIQTLKKEGTLTISLEKALLNCRSADELDHVYAPYKKGSKLSKVRRARQLGLEPPALVLLESPQTLNLHSYIQPQSEGLSTLAEVEAGVQQILADMIAKDKETLVFVKRLCEQDYITIHSTVSKTALKEQKDEKGAKPKDIDKFQLYADFTANVKNVHHHQILAINRGENLKILTVKVNIPDRVKNEFIRWCLNVRWRPKGYARDELFKLLKDAVEDSYKRLIQPLLCRAFRSGLTTSAEKESIAMFVRNLRQLLLTGPVRGRVLMGVDPGYRHGCKLAVLSPTSQILHTDVVYLHGGNGFREAEKIRHLLRKYNCYTVVIGNGTACRETEAYFADLIAKKYFEPLDVTYCITSEAGASIYSVSPEAVKEMPDLDPNLRSAVSIGRRVQDPLAELVKIDPKHIGIGTYQHDVSQPLLKAALASVVEECVSFVGVDINICSETLMRHVAGLNAGRAKNIMEWREKNGPFINRGQLKEVKGVGPTTFQQCAGFIRINPENLKSICSQQSVGEPGGQASGAGVPNTAGAGGAAGKPPSKKSKSKTTGSAAQQLNPLDQTCIHPESYDIAMRFLVLIGGNLQDIGKPEMQSKVNAATQKEGLREVAQKLNTVVPTLQIIIDGLTQPQGFDIRQGFDTPDFKRGIVSINDLKQGTVLTGRVENAALFGAFVDIGVGRSGLIHKKYITEAKLPRDERRRSLALGPGEKVEVRVLSVDVARGRIGLDLIRVLR
ncbi:S1 RNA-binding domain-containing protein 1 isoform X2 [Acipenser ruthenus]|uniref:S1 RNA-binding domain-containing protein 1 isoform X2 n=1 Tax=Acipenser ruthenus TaxID=7906 RepID=UPI002742706A|nr:S1 RNA-binding domain-containing protein 1 isoform X2 [Acipenser ruthenus]